MKDTTGRGSAAARLTGLKLFVPVPGAPPGSAFPMSLIVPPSAVDSDGFIVAADVLESMGSAGSVRNALAILDNALAVGGALLRSAAENRPH